MAETLLPTPDLGDLAAPVLTPLPPGWRPGHGDPAGAAFTGGFGGDDDFCGGGGGGDGEGDDDWPPRRFPRAVRIVSLVLAVSLAAGTAGTWVAVVVEGGDATYASEVTAVRPATTPVGTPAAAVRLTLDNEQRTADVPACTITVFDGETVLGSARGTLEQTVPAGGQVTVTALVPLHRPLPAAGVIAAAHCAPAQAGLAVMA